MNRPEQQAERSLSDEARREWEGHVASVLGGLAHALNNRAAAVSAVLELSNEPGQDVAPSIAHLSTEVQRLRELVDIVRTIAGEPSWKPEAFEPGDAATTAGRVSGLHTGLQDHAISFDVAAAAPIRVDRIAFVRALVALIASAAGGREGGAIAVVVAEDNGWVVIRVAGASAPTRLSPYTSEIVRALGGEPMPGALGFRLPTLASLRKQERR